MKVSGAETKLVTAGPEERERTSQAVAAFSAEDLTRYLQLLLDLYRDLQHATQARFRMEIGLLKLVYVGRLRAIEDVLADLGSSGGGGGVKAGSSRSSSSPRPASPAASKPAAVASREAAPAAAPARPAASAPIKERAIAALREAGDDFLAEALAHCSVEQTNAEATVRALPEERTTLELAWAQVDAAFKASGDITRARLGENLEASDGAAAPPAEATTAEDGSTLESEVAKRALADPDVQAFQTRFDGQVREVRNLRDY
jgi:DNA polymerase-3 subunit gamma/tau